MLFRHSANAQDPNEGFLGAQHNCTGQASLRTWCRLLLHHPTLLPENALTQQCNTLLGHAGVECGGHRVRGGSPMDFW